MHLKEIEFHLEKAELLWGLSLLLFGEHLYAEVQHYRMVTIEGDF